MPLFPTISAQLDNGANTGLSATGEGHLEVAIHDPLLPFGSIHTEQIAHQVQLDALYDTSNTDLIYTESASGAAVNVSSQQFVLTTGTTVGAYAVLASRKRIRYRPGQGFVGKTTAVFDASPVANSYQLVGFGHAESGVYYGYVGTAFGILYVTGGVREQRTFTVSVGSSHAENITIELNGVEYTVAVTNSGSTTKTAYEIASHSYAGWTATSRGAVVTFLAGSVGAKSGNYSITATSAAGSYAQAKAGVATTDTFIPQTTWNMDPMDGTGPSGVTLDPSKGNVYRFDLQYLGYGALTFRIETVGANNNPIFTAVHTIAYPNTYTSTNFSNPSFPFLATAYSAGSSTDLTLKVGSVSGGIEGEVVLAGPRFSYRASSASVGTSLLPLLTVRNDRVFAGRANQVPVRLMSITGAMKHNFSGEVYLIRNATLTGTPNFGSHSTTSCTSADYSATGVSYADNAQLVLTVALGDTGNFIYTFEDENTLQPGETVTLAAKTFSGTATSFIVGLNTREDQ